ncbi:MAG: Rrf2 family transcriptional regulator [Bacteroidales bacterium]|nr:Rrf2 family transcriptional regulator [Bacteroidales bacterium]
MSKIVHISEAASIAIHSLAIIASSPEMLNARQIAKLTGSSSNHLSKVMQLLVKNDYLKSTRGPNGGFILNKPANQITLLEVYEFIEGEIDCKFCGIPEEKCPFISCVFGLKAEIFSEEFVLYLKQTMISDLTTKPKIYASKDHSN